MPMIVSLWMLVILSVLLMLHPSSNIRKQISALSMSMRWLPIGRGLFSIHVLPQSKQRYR